MQKSAVERHTGHIQLLLPMTKNSANGTPNDENRRKVQTAVRPKKRNGPRENREVHSKHHEYPSLIVVSIAISKNKSRKRLGPSHCCIDASRRFQ